MITKTGQVNSEEVRLTLHLSNPEVSGDTGTVRARISLSTRRGVVLSPQPKFSILVKGEALRTDEDFDDDGNKTVEIAGKPPGTYDVLVQVGSALGVVESFTISGSTVKTPKTWNATNTGPGGQPRIEGNVDPVTADVLVLIYDEENWTRTEIRTDREGRFLFRPLPHEDFKTFLVDINATEKKQERVGSDAPRPSVSWWNNIPGVGAVLAPIGVLLWWFWLLIGALAHRHDEHFAPMIWITGNLPLCSFIALLVVFVWGFFTRRRNNWKFTSQCIILLCWLWVFIGSALYSGSESYNSMTGLVLFVFLPASIAFAIGAFIWAFSDELQWFWWRAQATLSRREGRTVTTGAERRPGDGAPADTRPRPRGLSFLSVFLSDIVTEIMSQQFFHK